MPRTARWRGLSGPFIVKDALFESARWLRELLDEFGNLGLAAAAYNAGPGRVQDWLAHRASLPSETRAYVRIITGRPADEWATAGVQQPREEEKRAIPCSQIVKLMRPIGQPRRDHIAEEKPPEWAPWGLQLAGARSEGTLRGVYAALQHKFPSLLGDRRPLVVRNRVAGMGTAPLYALRLAEQRREDADRLCNKLKSIGGTCVVLKN
jgi:SPOR domain/Transglycosylase SLT domain